MKYKKMALVLALGVGLSACNNQKPAENNANTEVSQEANNDKVDEKKVEKTNQNMESTSVYTSFYPIYNLTKQIAGDKFEVKSFTNLKTESHGWEPSAKDIADLTDSQLMFINGAGMEEWEESLEGSSDIELVNTSENVELIKGSHDHVHEHEDHDHAHEEENHDHEDHDHAHEEESHDHEDHDHAHEEENHDHEDQDHAHEHEHSHSHGEFDPHTWLSPKNGLAQAKVIADKLSEIDPANKDYYMENYKKIEDELNAMIDEYTEKFEKLENKNFLVSHQAFGYLARDFGLNQIALTSLTSTEDADAKTLKEAVDEAKNLGINTIFYEMGGSSKSADTIANELGANTVPLNTLEFATDEELNNDTTYQDLIKYNLEELYKSMAK
ncbi:zinc ABC transporter substrate-binding protein [Anaerococcus sp. mt242]|uniref:metal ABC transporter solute-binding protein, Zn/Mn family n=1 Tax=Anaerococcus sp. mt242 TaxID=2661917 RepID=UPI00193218C6|nr:zinc ABC transporter substrate-binding protein [Anaerococcus sp. mt242]MBM0046558.1 zinc ABC transporter substrate-binding protein [Anaerococcus sp. mt242]